MRQYEPELYPQGSFRLGAPIRPLMARDEFDIDPVCRLKIAKESTTQPELKDRVGNRLKADEELKKILKERRRYWQLLYGDRSASALHSVGDMTESGAVDVNALRDGRVETFHGLDCSEDTLRQFREWSTRRLPVVFVSDNPAFDFSGSTSTSSAISARIRPAVRGGALPTSTPAWSVTSETPRGGSGSDGRSTIIITCTTRLGRRGADSNLRR